ncbi:MAG: VTT domain-containing protein [Dehalococcoidia bacterium]|nr:VTT domain-containing protein [Dehalococcoidia bacterium]
MKKHRWLWLAISLIGLIAISFGVAYLFGRYLAPFQSRLAESPEFAYLFVFVTTLLASLTIVAPVPVAAAIMISAAAIWNPLLVALAASIGGTLGELSGYYAGRLGKKIAIDENTPGYRQAEGWMDRYGFWALSFLAFQPILPIDIGGLIAGTSRMPLWKFLPALWLGKFPKYILFCYSGKEVIDILPF